MNPSDTILVADDDHDIRTLIIAKLERAGYTVIGAADGAEALEMARTHRPRLALLDIMMPGLSGLEVTEAIRADAELSGMKIALLTAKARDTDVEAGYAVGADDYLIKPFSPRELVGRIQTLLDAD